MTKLSELNVSDKDLAELAGVSDRHIRYLAETGILSRQARGKYQLGPAFKSLLDNAANAASEFQRERTRKMRAEADLAEVNAAKAIESVVDVDFLAHNLSALFAEICASMRNIPDRIASSLVGENDERILKRKLLQEIDMVLTALANSEAVIEGRKDESE